MNSRTALSDARQHLAVTSASAPDRDAEVDALRRRMYAPGATEDDVRRYRLASAPVPVSTPGRAPGLKERVRPRRRGRPAWWWMAPIAAAVAVGAIGLGAVRQDAAPRPAPTPVVVPAAARDRFVADLRYGAATRISDYFVAHPDRLPTVLTAAHRAEVGQLAAVGPGALDLYPSAIAESGGRLTVVVVAAADAPMRWSATRDARTRGVPARPVVVASSAGSLTAGLPAAATTAYRSGAPTRIHVDLPAGVHWAAFAALTD